MCTNPFVDARRVLGALEEAFELKSASAIAAAFIEPGEQPTDRDPVDARGILAILALDEQHRRECQLHLQPGLTLK